MPIINVVLIDDEERFLKTTQLLLEKEGCRVWTAADGSLGLALLKEKKVDVVVLDVKMPGMDGMEVLRRIKSDFPLVEVVMLTGHGTMETAIQGLKMGAADYLPKPCDIPLLREKVQEAYARRAAALGKIQKAKLDRIIGDPLEVFVKD